MKWRASCTVRYCSRRNSIHSRLSQGQRWLIIIYLYVCIYIYIYYLFCKVWAKAVTPKRMFFPQQSRQRGHAGSTHYGVCLPPEWLRRGQCGPDPEADGVEVQRGASHDHGRRRKATSCTLPAQQKWAAGVRDEGLSPPPLPAHTPAHHLL